MGHRFHFSIGQVMGLIALSALLMANAIFVTQGNFTFYSVFSAAILSLDWASCSTTVASHDGCGFG